MILEKDFIQSVNRRMLDFGAPADRDYMGYNIPDYRAMEGYGRYLGELSDAACVRVLETFLHYTNTQLHTISVDDLKESIEHYKSILPPEEQQAKGEMISRDPRHYMPLPLKLVGICEMSSHLKGIAFHFDNFYELDSFWEKAGRDKDYSICCWDRSTGHIFVVRSYINTFLEDARERAPYGYALSEEDTGRLNTYLAEPENEIKKPVVKLIKQDQRGVTVFFSGFLPAFQAFKNEVGSTNARSVKSGSEWHSFASYDVLPQFIKMLEENGYDTSSISNIEVPDPITLESGLSLVDYHQFNLPFEPYPFQLEDATAVVSKKRMLLGHDMGCGKTFIAVLVGESIKDKKLVIVPESLRLNWRKEIRQVNPDADIKVLYSNKPFEVGGDWTIVGYSTSTKFEKELMAEHFKCIFIDEAHLIKAVNNSGKPDSKRAKTAVSLCENATYVYPMTGTPIPTRNKDVFNILKLLEAPEVITGDRGDFFRFGKRYCNGIETLFGWDFSGNTHGKELGEILSKHMVRRLKSDVLPNLTKQRIFIPIETRNREYLKLEHDGCSDGAEGTYLAFAMTGRRLLSKEKTTAGIELAETIIEQGKSVVLVSEFNESIDEIAAHFGDDCCTIRGGMSDKAKDQAITDFQSGKKHVCALNMIAGGVGITLTKASDMIICDYDWTPSNMSQVEDRINRAGQTSSCIIYYLYCENAVLDKVFMGMITEKSANIDQVVDKLDNTMEFNDDTKENRGYIDRLKELFPPKEKEKKEKKSTRKKEGSKTDRAG